MAIKPHVVVIPFPAQGHVMPLMKLSSCLADRGVTVTFVNTESIHAKLMDALPEKGKELLSIHMVAIPDGLTAEERNDPFTTLVAIPNTLPQEFGKLMKKMMESSTTEKITCVIADEAIGCALDVATKMGVRGACLATTSARAEALLFNIPKLIELGVIDDKGTPKKDETVLLSPNMPAIHTDHFIWRMGDLHMQQKIFTLKHTNHRISQSADWVLCNSTDQLEHEAMSLVPNLLPIGPLLANNGQGSLFQGDLTCINWLNEQVNCSVIYVAFGSLALLNQRQFNELALGLELLGRPFLWVVRGDGTDESEFPDGFQDGVAQLGKIVTWAPQQEVLAHPSIACFVSHCGWNSTMDGVITGVPFITWPHFGDQFFNETYITDVWKVGLKLNSDEDGIITRAEIRQKVDQLLGNNTVKENATKLKETVMNSVSECGSSSKNFGHFVEELKRLR